MNLDVFVLFSYFYFRATKILHCFTWDTVACVYLASQVKTEWLVVETRFTSWLLVSGQVLSCVALKLLPSKWEINFVTWYVMTQMLSFSKMRNTDTLISHVPPPWTHQPTCLCPLHLSPHLVELSSFSYTTFIKSQHIYLCSKTLSFTPCIWFCSYRAVHASCLPVGRSDYYSNSDLILRFFSPYVHRRHLSSPTPPREINREDI